MSLRTAIGVLLRSGSGRVGVALLLLLVGASFYVLATYPLDYGSQKWNNPVVWADNPKAVPPAWTKLFTGRRRVTHTVLEAGAPTEVAAGEGEERVYRLKLPYNFDEPPTLLSFTVSDVTYHARPPLVTVSVVRPDGREVLLYRHVVRGPRPEETFPISRYVNTPMRVLLSADPTVQTAVSDFLRREFQLFLSSREARDVVNQALFGVPAEGQPGGFQVLPGDYEVLVRVSVSDKADSVGAVRFVVGGAVFGLLGTDSLGRDLAEGLLFGLPVALFIGLLAAVLTTTIGATLGIISGYMGGMTDTLIQRLSDIVANIPVLPLLIFMVFVLGSHLMLIILVLVAFSWPGLTILVRSMVLQIRSGQLVEASLALGASKRRIMFRHIFPQTAPFVFAQMIFLPPAAILAEAALSFLGLGDPSLPTWGQILEAGFRTGGVYLGYWWWVVPPGVLIVITALTFMFLALGMEAVVNPRLNRVA